jgi:type VI secretion system protein ImpM
MPSLAVPWAASPQVGIFGKLPSEGDFLHVTAGDDQKWCEWLQRGVERASVRLASNWSSTFDAGRAFGFLMRQGTGAVIGGVLKPSRDSVGRRFPLSAYVQLAPNELPAVRHLVPWALSSFNRAIQGVLDDTAGPHAVETARNSSVQRVAADQGEAQYREWLATTAATPWFGTLWGRPDAEFPRYSVAMIASSLAQYVGQDHTNNPLALRLPLGGDLRAAAFWLDLVRRVGGWKATVPTLFWDAVQGRHLLVQLGETKPSSFVELWAPGTDDEHVIDLCSLSAVNSQPFMAGVAAPLAQSLSGSSATLADILYAAGNA